MNDNILINWITENYEWLFSGIGVIILVVFFDSIKNSMKGIKRKAGKSIKLIGEFLEKDKNIIEESSQKAINVRSGLKISEIELERLKKTTNVLFIDDDPKFKVVNILKTAGWENTTCVTDIDKIDDKVLVNAHIVFVDVQGVGIELNCKDEGLGLALLIKRRFNDKKVVIYSAVTKGERFHEALRVADDFLEKNAEPYEFLQLVEEYSHELLSNG